MGRWRSIEGALQKLDDEIFKVKNRSLSGLRTVQKIIHENMDTIPPLIPVDTGNLKRSYYSVASSGAIYAGRNPNFSDKNKDADTLDTGHGMALAEARQTASDKSKMYGGPAITLGLSAYYRFWVHENYGANFKRPGSGAGFFAAAISRTIPIVKATIAKEVKIRK